MNQIVYKSERLLVNTRVRERVGNLVLLFPHPPRGTEVGLWRLSWGFGCSLATLLFTRLGGEIGSLFGNIGGAVACLWQVTSNKEAIVADYFVITPSKVVGKIFSGEFTSCQLFYNLLKGHPMTGQKDEKWACSPWWRETFTVCALIEHSMTIVCWTFLGKSCGGQAPFSKSPSLRGWLLLSYFNNW